MALLRRFCQDVEKAAGKHCGSVVLSAFGVGSENWGMALVDYVRAVERVYRRLMLMVPLETFLDV